MDRTERELLEREADVRCEGNECDRVARTSSSSGLIHSSGTNTHTPLSLFVSLALQHALTTTSDFSKPSGDFCQKASSGRFLDKPQIFYSSGLQTQGPSTNSRNHSTTIAFNVVDDSVRELNQSKNSFYCQSSLHLQGF